MQPFLGSLAVSCLLSLAAEGDRGAADWPQWRGPLGTGVAPDARPPLEWGDTKNIRWKTVLPGRGHSTPIVWGERIFLTTAIPYGEPVKPRLPPRPGAHDNLAMTHRHEFAVLALDRRTAKLLWQKTVHKDIPHEAGHVTASLASASPVTDGERIFASFGSRGVYCLDLSGKLLWQKQLGEMHTKHGHGEGSSPVLSGDTLVINWDQEGNSFLIALDKRTGKQIWKVTRAEDTSWATPIVVEHQGKRQVIVPGTHRLRGYDLAGGAVIWECGGLSSNIVASPVAAGGVVYAGSSYDTRNVLAIRLDGAKGDITGSGQVLWSRRRGAPYVPSPLLYGQTLYTLAHYQGIVSRVDIKSGEDRGGPFRLEAIDEVYASPVAAAGRVYVTSRDGVTQVISHGEQAPRTLAVNRLDDRINASAAIAGREIYLRGEKHLYCIAENPIDKLKKLGARIQLDDKKRVIGVNLGERRTADADLALLKGLDHLQELDLTRTGVTSAGLVHLKDLTTLKKLFLTDTKVDNGGIDKLKEMKSLETLGLSGTKITDPALTHLQALTGLKSLFCIGTGVTDAGVKKLRKALPGCRIVH